MKASVLAFLIAAALVLPTTVFAQESQNSKRENRAENRAERKAERKDYYQGQRAENQDFRKTLKDMSPEQKAEAIISHRETQFAENVAHHEALHQERMKKLRDRLSANTEMTAEQKQEILTKAQKEYEVKAAAAKAKRTEKLEESKEKMSERIAEKKERMTERQTERKEKMEERQTERKEKMENRRDEFRKNRQDKRKSGDNT